MAPEHKVLLVDTLKKKGDVVAMTGDGVNDAPAIKAADIGIAMGSGTDVAKNAGRMILSDDNFATIVFAVEQGRKIYDNLTKYIRFVLILLVVFVLTFLGASLFNIAAGEPFTPAQILWIHFFVNAAFGLALGFDQETPGLMQTRPRPRGESLLTPRLIVTVGLTGLLITIGLLLLIALGADAVRRPRGGQVRRVHLLLAVPDRGRPRVPQRDRDRADHRHVRQQADELDAARRVRARGAGHPDGRLQPTAGHDADHPGPVRLGARAGRRRCWSSGNSASSSPGAPRPGDCVRPGIVRWSRGSPRHRRAPRSRSHASRHEEEAARSGRQVTRSDGRC